MAVYTHITEAQLQEFLGHYNLGALKNFQGIAQGVENTNYKVETTGRRFILTLFEKRVDPEDLPFFFAFTDHLHTQGVACPKAVSDIDGEVIRVLAGRPAALITFLNGRDIKAGDISPSHCNALGGMQARMHEVALSFKQQRRNTLGLEGWKSLAQRTADRADTVEEGLSKLIAGELEFLERHWPDENVLPRAVIHADLFPDNVLFEDVDISGVIDFYFSCTDFLAYDLALTVNAWCFDVNFRFVPERWQALRDAYQQQRKMQPQEAEFLSILCRGAALRILLTRLYDRLNHPAGALVQPKDPKEYSAILRWHQHEKIGC